MKQYGRNSTHLKLTGKALEGYTLAGDITIIEREDVQDYTVDGETYRTEHVYSYDVKSLDGTTHYDTEAELIAQLEEYADLFRVDDNEKQFGAYTVSPCTAVALCDGEDESHRQPAVYVTTVTGGGERVEHVVFGWRYADLETDADFGDMSADSTAWEPLTDEHHVKF